MSIAWLDQFEDCNPQSWFSIVDFTAATLPSREVRRAGGAQPLARWTGGVAASALLSALIVSVAGFVVDANATTITYASTVLDASSVVSDETQADGRSSADGFMIATDALLAEMKNKNVSGLSAETMSRLNLAASRSMEPEADIEDWARKVFSSGNS